MLTIDIFYIAQIVQNIVHMRLFAFVSFLAGDMAMCGSSDLMI